jgi:hypothetical protein
MICHNLTSLLGLECIPLTSAGEVALISTPFTFDDGESLPVFAETVGGQVRFFDDGGVIMHFAGRGVRVDDGRRLRSLGKAAEAHGARLSEVGELEVWATMDEAPAAFARYIGALNQIVAWERDQRGISTDASIFVEEVAMALQARRPMAVIEREPGPFEGISGQQYKLDLLYDGVGVVATTPNANAISSRLHMLIDIRSRPANGELQVLVVIDDRQDPDAADREAKVMQSVGKVMQFSALGQEPFGTRQ